MSAATPSGQAGNPDPAAGRLVVLSGPSGVGKTALTDLLQERWGCGRAITATTRAPRSGERSDVDYYFYERDEFERGIRTSAFLEHAEVHGNLYGTPWQPLAERLRSGEVVFLVIDVQGARQLQEGGRVEATYVFVEPPDMEELERRLRGRQSDQPEVVARRLEAARQELAQRDRYQYRIVNDDLDRAAEELACLLRLAVRERN